MLRRFILVGLMVVIYNGTMLQLTLGTLFAAVLLFVQVQASPFVSLADDYLSSATNFSLLAAFLCARAARPSDCIAPKGSLI